MTAAQKLSLERVIVDTREQKPLFGPPALTIGLPTGDYSVVGMTDAIVVERKSVSDLFGSVGRGRDRFRAEFERMTAIRYRAVVVEGSMGAIMRGQRYGRVKPAHALGTMGSWSMEYQVPVFYCDGRAQAKWYTMTLLRLAAAKVEGGR